MPLWYEGFQGQFIDHILTIDHDVAAMSALLRVSIHENALDKFIAAPSAAYCTGEYSQKDIAGYPEIHYSTVRRALS